jgi:hypothetical protein
VIPEDSIQSIRVLDRFSFVEVDAEQAGELSSTSTGRS